MKHYLLGLSIALLAPAVLSAALIAVPATSDDRNAPKAFEAKFEIGNSYGGGFSSPELWITGQNAATVTKEFTLQNGVTTPWVISDDGGGGSFFTMGSGPLAVTTPIFRRQESPDDEWVFYVHTALNNISIQLSDMLYQGMQIPDLIRSTAGDTAMVVSGFGSFSGQSLNGNIRVTKLGIETPTNSDVSFGIGPKVVPEASCTILLLAGAGWMLGRRRR